MILDIYGILTNRTNNQVFMGIGIPMLSLRTVDTIREYTRVIPTPANPRPGNKGREK